MKTAMRVAVCLMVAAISAPAFAGDEEAARTTRAGNERAQGIETTAKMDSMRTSDDADFGAGSGEPSPDAARRARDEARAERAAIQEYNQRRFLEQTWTVP